MRWACREVARVLEVDCFVGSGRRLTQELGPIDDVRGAVFFEMKVASGGVRDCVVVAVEVVQEPHLDSFLAAT
jgi:hypothetical protein